MGDTHDTRQVSHTHSTKIHFIGETTLDALDARDGDGARSTVEGGGDWCGWVCVPFSVP